MALHSVSAIRWALVVLLACGTLIAQAPLLNAGHDHHDARHCCGLCHVGPLPVLTEASTPVFGPDLSFTWLAAVDPPRTSHEAVFSHTSSRAPPR